MRLFVASAAVIAVLSAALVSCSKHSVAGVEIDPRLQGFILPGTRVLAGVDFDKIKQADFYKRHQDQFNLPQLNQLPQQIGIDPRKDLSTLVISWDGADVLAMIHGSYSSDQLEKRLSASAQSEKFNKLTLYGDGKRDIVFMPRGIALGGSAQLLKKALNEDAAGNNGMPEDLQMQLARLSRNAQVWEVSTGVLPLNQMPIRNDTASALANITSFINGSALGITFFSGVALDLHLSCISEEGSQRVNDALRGVIGFARLNTRDNQLDQLKIWDSIKVEKQAKEVHVTVNLPADLADKVVTMVPSLTKGF